MAARFILGEGRIEDRCFVCEVDYTGVWSQAKKSFNISLLIRGSLERGMIIESVAQYRIKMANRGLRFVKPSEYATLDNFFEDAFCRGLEDFARETRMFVNKAQDFVEEIKSRPLPEYGQTRA